MALQGLASSQAPEYKGLDLNIIGDAAKMRQQNFIKANEAMSNTLQALQTQDFVDEEARAQATSRAQARYDDLVKRTQNNLGAALPDVMTAVRETAADPYNMYNKYQMENLKAQNKLKGELGDRAIVVNDVANQRISEHIDPTGKVTEPVMLKNKLSADVREASDYIKVAQSLGDKLNPNLRPIGLSNVAGYDTFLKTGSVNELSEKDIRALANDPSVRSAFMSGTTAGIDNRANVEYDPETGTNKFTRAQPEGSKFADGAAQEIYAALIQKKDRDVKLNYIQDRDALAQKAADRKASADVQDRANVPLGHGEKSITMENLFGLKDKDLLFDEQGAVKKTNPKATLAASMLAASGVKVDKDTFLGDKKGASKSKDEEFLTTLKTNYGLPESFTPKATFDVLKSTEKNMQKIDVSPILLPGDAGDRFGEFLVKNFYKQSTAGDKGEFTLGNAEGLREFKSKHNLDSDWTPQKALKEGTLLIHSINSIGDSRLNKAAPGSFGVTLIDKNGQPNELEISSPNKEARAIFAAPTKVMSNIGSGVVNDRMEFTGSYDLVQQNIYNATNNSIEPVLTLAPKGGAITMVNPSTGDTMSVSDISQFKTLMTAANKHMNASGMKQAEREAYLDAILPERTNMEGVRKFTEDAFKTSSSTVESLLGKTSSATTNKTLETLQPGT